MSAVASAIKALVTNRTFLTMTREAAMKSSAGAAVVGGVAVLYMFGRLPHTESSLVEDLPRKEKGPVLDLVCVNTHRLLVSEFAKNHESSRISGRDHMARALREYMARHGAVGLNAAMITLVLEPALFARIGQLPTAETIERAVAETVNKMADAKTVEEALPELSIEKGRATRTTTAIKEFRQVMRAAYATGVRIEKVKVTISGETDQTAAASA